MKSGPSTWCAAKACCMALKIGSGSQVSRGGRGWGYCVSHISSPCAHRVGVQVAVQGRRAGAGQAHQEDRPLDRYVARARGWGVLKSVVWSAGHRPARS